MFLHIEVDSLIRSFKHAKKYAETHNHGNEAGIYERVVRDLESIRHIPAEAYAGVEPPSSAIVPPSQATLREARMTGMDYPVPVRPRIDNAPEDEVNREIEPPADSQ